MQVAMVLAVIFLSGFGAGMCIGAGYTLHRLRECGLLND